VTRIFAKRWALDQEFQDIEGVSENTADNFDGEDQAWFNDKYLAA
jgi:hypothetical protein